MGRVIESLDKLDRRWVFLLIAVAVIVPVIGGWTFKETASPLVKAVYNHIEEMPEGSRILLACDYDPGSEPELQPMATAVARHLTERKHKIFFIGLWPVGPRMIENTIREVILVHVEKVIQQAAWEMDVPLGDLREHGLAVAKDFKGAATEEDLQAVTQRILGQGISEEEEDVYRALAVWFYVSIDIVPEMRRVVEAGFEGKPEAVERGIEEIRKLVEGDAQLMKIAAEVKKGVLDRSHPEMVYGVDYVNLGYKAGNEGVIIVIATDLKKLYTTDHRGTGIDDIPMTKEITSIQEMDLILSISAGYVGTKEWIQYAAQPYGIPIAAGNTGVQAPLMYPYIPEPLFGILGAIKGAAEYEALLREGYPKFEPQRLHRGVERMGPQMIAHMAIMLLIIIGNITYFATRRRAGGRA